MNAVRLTLYVESGPLAGGVYQFNEDKLTIGRAPENSVCLEKDLKASRYHAQIVNHKGALVIKNISENNSLMLNGKKVKIGVLKESSKVQLGDSVFLIQAVSQKESTKDQVQIVHNPKTHAKLYQKPIGLNDFLSARLKQNKFRITYFHIIIIGLVILSLYFFVSKSRRSKKWIEQVRTDVQAQEELNRSQDEIEKIQKEREKSEKNTIQYEKSQELYLKGFRDYRLGQYSRALSSFQAALSFYPQHLLALKYYNLAKIKQDEQIKYLMIMGHRYLNKNNYRMCMSSFRKVMDLVKESNDKMFIEARQYYNECEYKKGVQ